MSDLLPGDGRQVAVGAALSYVEGEFGGPLDESSDQISVGAAVVTKLVGNDPERLALVLINLGSSDIYIMFDNEPSATRGILLQASGGYVSMTVRDDGLLPTREWYGYAPSDSTDVFVIRTYRYALT